VNKNRRFLWIIGVSVLLISGLIAGNAVINSLENEDDSNSSNLLRFALTDEGCANPCWLGIEVGLTREESAVDILNQNNIIFTIAEAPGDQDIYNFTLGTDFPFWRKSGEPANGSLITLGGTVVVIGLSVDVCVSSLLDAFGEPLVVPPGPDSFYSLYYPGFGLSFWLHEETNHTWNVMLRTKALTREILNEYPNAASWKTYSDTLVGECIDDFTD
jgi:hypothetical protein